MDIATCELDVGAFATQLVGFATVAAERSKPACADDKATNRSVLNARDTKLVEGLQTTMQG